MNGGNILHYGTALTSVRNVSRYYKRMQHKWSLTHSQQPPQDSIRTTQTSSLSQVAPHLSQSLTMHLSGWLLCKVLLVTLLYQQLAIDSAESTDTKDLLERLKVPPRFGKRSETNDVFKGKSCLPNGHSDLPPGGYQILSDTARQ